jgi:hypothetical protein
LETDPCTVTKEGVKTPTFVVETNTDFMEKAAKVKSLDKVKLDSPKCILKSCTRLKMDTDIEQHREDLAQEARQLAVMLAAAEQECLKAKNCIPVQPHYETNTACQAHPRQ